MDRVLFVVKYKGIIFMVHSGKKHRVNVQFYDTLSTDGKNRSNENVH